MLKNDAVLFLSKDVMTRPDSNGVLIFQVRTDEMHFVSENAFALLALCDGSRTVSEIKNFAAEFQPESGRNKLRTRLEKFLESLVERRVLELWS